MTSAILRNTIVAATLTFGVFSAPHAFAGTKETAAINLKLAPNTIANSTPEAIANAVLLAIQDPANKKLKPAIIVADALKLASGNIGQELGEVILAAKTAGTLPTSVNNIAKPAVFSTFVGASALSAATGTGANATQVSPFADALFTTQDEYFAAAKAATKSKTAVGAIVGGYSDQLELAGSTDAAQTALIVAALADPKLAPSAQDIARNIGQNVNDIGAFVVAASTDPKKGTPKMVLLATGATQAQVNSGHEILQDLFANTVYSAATKKVTGPAVGLAAVKNASKLAASLSLQSDIENVQLQADQIGTKIGDNVLKTTQVATLTKALVAGINNRPSTTDINANRADEVGEVGALIIRRVLQNAAFTNDISALSAKAKATAQKAAVGIVSTLIKTIYTASAKTYNFNTRKLAADKTQQGNIARDAAGSIALTIFSALQAGSGIVIDDEIKAALDAAFGTLASATSTLSKIVGKTLAPEVAAAFVAGYTNTNYSYNSSTPKSASAVFEDGFFQAGNLVDPETDIRSL